MEIGSLSNKRVQIMIIKIIKELGRRMDEQSEKLEVSSKELENIKQNVIKQRTTIT